MPNTPRQTALLGDLETILLPNGEVSIYKLKRLPERHTPRPHRTDIDVRVREMTEEERAAIAEGRACPLGLSPLRNFDQTEKKSRERYGTKGITGLGKRRVRNACHLLENRHGRQHLTFATVTVPPLPEKSMRVVHENWHKVIASYRRKIRRALKKEGLSGELVSVSEIQGERHKETGLPVLHLHTVFCGRHKGKGWCISPEAHDKMWGDSISSVVRGIRVCVHTACNLKRVHKSAEMYLGKYMTKGAKEVGVVVQEGLGGWLPKQWFSLTRDITKEIREKTRRFRIGSALLADLAKLDEGGIWMWHRSVIVEMSDGYKINVALFGRLTAYGNRWIRDFLGTRGFDEPRVLPLVAQL